MMTTEELYKKMIETLKSLMDFNEYFLKITAGNDSPEIIKARTETVNTLADQTVRLGNLLQTSTH